jgi:hypothetical protein
VLFSGDDIAGVDVKLEQSTELDHHEESKQQMALAKRQYGLVSDLDWRRIVDRPGLGSQKQLAEEFIAQYLAMPVPTPEMMPLDQVDPMVLAAVVAKKQAIALSMGQRQLWVDLERLARLLRDVGSPMQTQEQEPKPPGAPPSLEEQTQVEAIPDPNVV